METSVSFSDFNLDSSIILLTGLLLIIQQAAGVDSADCRGKRLHQQGLCDGRFGMLITAEKRLHHCRQAGLEILLVLHGGDRARNITCPSWERQG